MASRAAAKSNRFIMLTYILPFLMIMLLSMAVGIVIYERTSSVLEEEVKAANRVLLEQGMGVIENQLESLDAIIRKMSGDSKVERLQQISEPFSSGNLYQVIETRQRLQDYSIASDLVLNYYVLFKNSGLVLNSDIIARLEEAAGLVVYPRERSDFLNSLAQSYHYREVLPEGPVTLNGRTFSALTYLHSFGFSNYSAGTVMALLNGGEIRKLLGGLNIRNGWAYIADSEGRILTRIAGGGDGHPSDPLELPGPSGVMSGRLGDQDMIVTYVTSAYNGWTYVAAQPSEVVLGKILYIKKTTFTIFFLFLFLVALIALYFANRNSKPVQALLQTVSRYAAEPAGSRGNALGRIQLTVTKIIESNVELQSKMEEQLPFLRASFFERLLRGQFSSESDMKAVMRSLKLNWGGEDAHLVAMLTFPADHEGYTPTDVERLNEKKAIVRDVARQTSPDGLYLHEVDEDKIALLFHFPSGGGAAGEVYRESERKLAALQDELERMYGIATRISVGGVCFRWPEISRSFLEARNALVRGHGSGIVWHKDMNTYRNGYVYPENMETRLVHLVRTGSEEELGPLLDELYQENFVRRDLPEWMLRVFVYDLTGTIVKLSGEAWTAETVAAGLPDTDSAKNIEALFQQLREQAMAMCRAVSDTRQSRQKQRFEDILKYINGHYDDPQMSLALLAGRFQVTETSLSRGFKDNTGINFFEYLETLRIERSKALLQETDRPVGEIALSVGYGSPNTFARAFKRTVGISAMAYREKIRAERKI